MNEEDIGFQRSICNYDILHRITVNGKKISYKLVDGQTGEGPWITMGTLGFSGKVRW